jgi:hypothetical protein
MPFFYIFLFITAYALRDTLTHHILNKHSHIISLNTQNPTIVHQCILDSLIDRQFSHIGVVSQNTYHSKLIFQQLTLPHQKQHLLNIKYSQNIFLSNIVIPTSLLFIDHLTHHYYQQIIHYKKIILLLPSYPHEIYVINKTTITPQPPP